MNSENLKCFHWLDLVKPNLQFYVKSMCKLAKLDNLVLFPILILMLNISLVAQTKSPLTPENSIEIVSFDWYPGRDWNAINDRLNNSWKNFNFADGHRDFRSILEENRKILTNQKEGFIYELTIQNNSPEKISALSWEYFFKNPINGEILGTHQFICQKEIKPHERKNLFVYSDNPPTNVITIELLQRNPQKPYLESATINSVSFVKISDFKTKNGF